VERGGSPSGGGGIELKKNVSIGEGDKGGTGASGRLRWEEKGF